MGIIKEGRSSVTAARTLLQARNDGLTGTGHSTTEYFFTFGVHNADATEANRQALITDDFEAVKLIVDVSANTTDADSTFTLRKNGLDTSLSITVPANTTGTYTDVATVSLAEGDKISIEATGGTGATGDSITFTAWSLELERTNVSS